MIRKICNGDVVYLILSPNSYVKEYRYVKCKVKAIYYRGSTQKDFVEWDSDNIPMKYRLTLTNADKNQVYYTNKYLDKIYFEDELDEINKDIINLNKITNYKKQQKEEFKEYIKKEFPNWKYRSKINGV